MLMDIEGEDGRGGDDEGRRRRRRREYNGLESKKKRRWRYRCRKQVKMERKVNGSTEKG